MKTTLPEAIRNQSEAEDFLRNLEENGEVFCPDDNAHDIIWSCEPPTPEECDKLNELMQQVAVIPEFDPFGYIMYLQGTEPEVEESRPMKCPHPCVTIPVTDLKKGDVYWHVSNEFRTVTDVSDGEVFRTVSDDKGGGVCYHVPTAHVEVKKQL